MKTFYALVFVYLFFPPSALAQDNPYRRLSSGEVHYDSNSASVDTRKLQETRIKFLKHLVKDPAKYDETGRDILVMAAVTQLPASELGLSEEEWKKIQAEARPRALRYLKSKLEECRQGKIQNAAGIEDDAHRIGIALAEVGDPAEIKEFIQKHERQRRDQNITGLKRMLENARKGNSLSAVLIEILAPLQKICYEEIGTTVEEIEKLSSQSSEKK